MREAIRLLAGEGLIQYTAARRPFVADPSLDEINDCLRVQGALEALAGELACTEASTQQLEEIAQINANIVDNRNDDTRLSAFQADMRFHESIVKHIITILPNAVNGRPILLNKLTTHINLTM